MCTDGDLPGGDRPQGKWSGCSPFSCRSGWERCALDQGETCGRCQVQLAGDSSLWDILFLGFLDDPRNHGLSVLVHLTLLRVGLISLCVLSYSASSPACLLEAGLHGGERDVEEKNGQYCPLLQ